MQAIIEHKVINMSKFQQQLYKLSLSISKQLKALIGTSCWFQNDKNNARCIGIEDSLSINSHVYGNAICMFHLATWRPGDPTAMVILIVVNLRTWTI
jgi:hypothetical protein